MSRAFVKDDDDRPEPPIRRTPSDRPNYVTPRGYAQLQAAIEAARAAGNDGDVGFWEERLRSAILVELGAQPQDRVAFGAIITARHGEERFVYQIVGEDEADPTRGRISWTSPLAQALLDHAVGESVTWDRPIGSLRLQIERIDGYDIQSRSD
jgi:transcription elongation factor GreB